MNRRTFTVKGVFPFPIDMLRYDCCWPLSQHDTYEMELSLERVRDGHGKISAREVTLTSVLKTAPTVGRWASFGWTVVESPWTLEGDES